VEAHRDRLRAMLRRMRADANVPPAALDYLRQAIAVLHEAQEARDLARFARLLVATDTAR
jgi:hypothetical protein